MTAPLPIDVLQQLAPMPADFAPPIISIRGRPAWRGNVQVVTPGQIESVQCECAVGDGQKGADQLRVHVWVIQELARLGRGDLIAWARRDRHRSVKPSVPQWAP